MSPQAPPLDPVAASGDWLALEEPGSPALGRDPFAERIDVDPFVERLESIDAGRSSSRSLRPAAPRPTPAPRPQPRRQPPATVTRARRSQVPALDEVELPGRLSWIDRLLGEDERRRLAALAHLAEGEVPYDRFGFSPEVTRNAFPWFQALYRYYFRVKSTGHENIPKSGPAVMVGNHAGLLPFDAAMGVVDCVLNTDPPRLPRAVVDRWAGSLPWVNIFYARVGQVIGT
ncbi:MAG: hypothetical protein QNK04_34205, partial [Myxococcota bacterium]|nr:hypothetical protein [Myxococcota bacterium]